MTRNEPKPADRGRVERLRHCSCVLAGNPWNDPVERDLLAYLPPGYVPDRERRYPVLWHLAAYTNSGASLANWRNFGESLPERLDRLITTGTMAPAIVVAPDCFTRLGGNQYVNSPAVGAYEDYIHDELVPFVEDALRVLPGSRHRAVFGKSSGGYGALRFAMQRPGFWRAVASHAGDVQFDVIFRRDFPIAAGGLAPFGGDVDAFIEAFWNGESVTGSQVHTLMLLCMAASYDPDPAQPRRLRLPFDPETLELDSERWANWLAHDPLLRIDECAEALKSLAGVHIDCGNRDQYFMQYGTRLLARRLRQHDVDVRYEEFDGTHSGIDHRFDESLPYLLRLIEVDS